jgi:hypothetical protein
LADSEELPLNQQPQLDADITQATDVTEINSAQSYGANLFQPPVINSSSPGVSVRLTPLPSSLPPLTTIADPSLIRRPIPLPPARAAPRLLSPLPHKTIHIPFEDTDKVSTTATTDSNQVSNNAISPTQSSVLSTLSNLPPLIANRNHFDPILILPNRSQQGNINVNDLDRRVLGDRSHPYETAQYIPEGHGNIQMHEETTTTTKKKKKKKKKKGQVHNIDIISEQILNPNQNDLIPHQDLSVIIEQEPIPIETQEDVNIKDLKDTQILPDGQGKRSTVS